MYAMNKEELAKMGEVAKVYYDKNFAKDMVIDRVNEILKK